MWPQIRIVKLTVFKDAIFIWKHLLFSHALMFSQLSLCLQNLIFGTLPFCAFLLIYYIWTIIAVVVSLWFIQIHFSFKGFDFKCQKYNPKAFHLMVFQWYLWVSIDYYRIFLSDFTIFDLQVLFLVLKILIKSSHSKNTSFT